MHIKEIGRDLSTILSQILTNQSHNNIHTPIHTRVLEEIVKEERKIEKDLKEVVEDVEELICDERHSRSKNKQVRFFIESNNITITIKGNTKMAFTLTDAQSTTITATVLDAAGAVLTAPETLVWSTSNAAAVSITPSADTLSAVATSTGLGDAVITVTLGEITATFDITVVAGVPASITLAASAAFSTPVATPTPAPVAPAPVVDPTPAPVAPVVQP